MKITDTSEQALDAEQILLDKWFNTGRLLNICQSARGMLGFKHSIESRQANSDRGKKRFEKYGANNYLIKFNTGRKQSIETIAKRIEKVTGQKRSDACKKSMSEIAKKAFENGRIPNSLGVKRSFAIKEKLRAAQTLLNGVSVSCEGKEYASICSAARDFNITHGGIIYRLNSENKKWKKWYRV